MSRQELEALRAKKRKRLQELEAKSRGKGSSGSLPRFKHTVSDPEGEQITAMGAGLSEGVTLGNTAEIIAGVQATSDVLFDNYNISSFGESYIHHRNENEKAIDELEKKHAVEFNAANLVGHIVSAPKNIPLSVGAAAIAGIGYSNTRLRSETMTLQEAMTASVKGVGYEIIGRLGPQAIGKGVDYLRSKASGFYRELKSGTVLEALGFTGENKTKLMGRLRAKGIELNKWTDDVLYMKNKNGDRIIQTGQSYKETYDKAVSFRGEIGEGIGKIVSEVSDDVGKMDGGNIYNQIKRKHLSPLLNSKHVKTRKLAEKYDKELKEDFFDTKMETVLKQEGEKITKEQVAKIVPKQMTINDLHALKKDMADMYTDTRTGLPKNFTNAKDTMAGKMNSKSVGSITGTMEDVIENSNYMRENKGAFNKWKKLKNNYGDLKEITSALGQTIDRIDSPGVLNALKEAINYRGLVVSGIARTIGAPPKLALSIGMAVNKIATHPSTPATMAVQLRSLADAFAKNPNKYQSLAALVGGAAAKSNLALAETLSYANAEITLSNQKIKRTSNDIIGKRDMFLTVLHQTGFLDEAAELREALNTEDQGKTGKILNALSHAPELTHLFEQGIGWNGKTTTKEEVAMMEQKIKSKFSLRKQSELITKLRIDGSIPNFEETDKQEKQKVTELAKKKAGQRVKQY